MRLQATAAQLQEGIRTLTRRLKEEVAVRQPELLQQAVSLRDAEDAMQVCSLVLHFLTLPTYRTN